MGRFDDTALWNAYDAAVAAGQDSRPHAAAIVEFHLGFLRDYAQRTIWPAMDLDEYVAELVCVAMVRVGHYDRTHTGHGGRVAVFPTYLRPYLQEVRWRITAAAADLPTGKETRRMIAAAQQCIGERAALGEADPTPEEIDDYVSSRLGKRIGIGRIERALAMPVVERGDARVTTDTEGAELWDRLADATPSPETQVIAAIEADELAADVAGALAAAELTELDKALIAERLMAPPRRVLDGEVVSFGPAPYRVLAERYGLSSTEVKAAEEALKDRLRDLLADYG
jgi:hypothetical protein